MKYAIIEDGKVANLIEWDGEAVLEGLHPVLVPEGAAVDIGTAYDGTAFAAPSEPAAYVPQEVTMRQARLALLAAGQLSAVGAAIAKMPSPQKEQAQIEWDYATTVRRDWALVTALGAALGLTEKNLDDLFSAAVQL